MRQAKRSRYIRVNFQTFNGVTINCVSSIHDSKILRYTAESFDQVAGRWVGEGKTAVRDELATDPYQVQVHLSLQLVYQIRLNKILIYQLRKLREAGKDIVPMLLHGHEHFPRTSILNIPVGCPGFCR